MAQTLGSVAVGTVVKINESGSPVNYLVVHQGKPSSMYDASCDGTWLLRQDIAENRVWDSGNSNVLESSDIQSYLNGTWINRYDTDIRNAIKQVKIPYRQNGGSGGTDRTGANGLSCKIFLLSGYEVGWTQSDYQYFPVDGAKLSYFTSGTSSAANNKRIAYLNGSATIWWLRSPYTNNTSGVWYVNSGGVYGYWNANSSRGVRPAFVLSKNIYVEDDGTVVLYPSPSPITVPSVAMQGQSINVSWSSVDGADSYILQRKADSGEWTQVYAGALTSYTDTAGSWSTVQYQVCGVFSGTNGAFAQSDSITVLAASALVISGTDGDLGTIVNDIPYSVATDTGNQISLTRTVNGAQVASLTVNSGFSYNIPVMDLPTGTNTIVITATVTASSGQVTATRTWTYTKAAQTFPGSGGLGQLTQNGQNLFPLTLAEAVKTIGGPWGGNLSSALNKLAMAATYQPTGDFYDLWGNVIPTVKIATGSYTGTGTYGSGNENSLVLPPWAKLLFVFSGNSSYGNSFYVAVGTNSIFAQVASGSSTTSNRVYFTWESSEDSVTTEWYGDASTYQANVSGVNYQYIVAG